MRPRPHSRTRIEGLLTAGPICGRARAGASPGARLAVKCPCSISCFPSRVRGSRIPPPGFIGEYHRSHGQRILSIIHGDPVIIQRAPVRSLAGRGPRRRGRRRRRRRRWRRRAPGSRTGRVAPRWCQRPLCCRRPPRPARSRGGRRGRGSWRGPRGRSRWMTTPPTPRSRRSTRVRIPSAPPAGALSMSPVPCPR